MQKDGGSNPIGNYAFYAPDCLLIPFATLFLVKTLHLYECVNVQVLTTLESLTWRLRRSENRTRALTHGWINCLCKFRGEVKIRHQSHAILLDVVKYVHALENY